MILTKEQFLQMASQKIRNAYNSFELSKHQFFIPIEETSSHTLYTFKKWCTEHVEYHDITWNGHVINEGYSFVFENFSDALFFQMYWNDYI